MASNQDDRGNQGGNANTNPGNFANDREKASEAGHKGGQVSGGISRTIQSAPRKQVTRVARHPAVISRTTLSGHPKLATRAARRPAATLPMTAKKPRKPDGSVASIATVAVARVMTTASHP